MSIGVNDVEEADDVGVVHLLEKRNLTDGCGWDALILSLKANLLEGDDAAIVEEIAGLINNTVGSCGDMLA